MRTGYNNAITSESNGFTYSDNSTQSASNCSTRSLVSRCACHQAITPFHVVTTFFLPRARRLCTILTLHNSLMAQASWLFLPSTYSKGSNKVYFQQEASGVLICEVKRSVSETALKKKYSSKSWKISTFFSRSLARARRFS